MIHTHKLSTQNHFDFLNQDRKDPITGDLIKENDEIVICSSCKSVFLKESWEYLGNTHCEQNKTLKTIPRRNNLELKTGLITSLPLAATENVLTQFFGVLFLELFMIPVLFLNMDDSLLPLLIIGFIVLLIPIAIGTLVSPTIRLDLHGSYLVSKKLIGKTKINYTDIKHIIINCDNSKKTLSKIHIKHNETGSTDIPLPIKYTYLEKNKELIEFVNYLSRYVKVVFMTNSSYKDLIEERNLDVKIEWI